MAKVERIPWLYIPSATVSLIKDFKVVSDFTMESENSVL